MKTEGPPRSALALDSPKLGWVSYGAQDVIRFRDGIPGFEHLRDFLIVSRDECAPFVFLTSLEAPEVAIPLLPLGLSAGEAAPQLAGAVLASVGAGTALGADRPELVCYTVAAIAQDATEINVNLRAPVVVDLDARRGCQLILSDETLPVSAPLGA